MDLSIVDIYFLSVNVDYARVIFNGSNGVMIESGVNVDLFHLMNHHSGKVRRAYINVKSSVFHRSTLHMSRMNMSELRGIMQLIHPM